MKKLMTRAERAKINRRNQFLVGVVLIVLMIISTLGYALMGGSSSTEENQRIDYNGIRFQQNSGVWIFEIGNQVFGTRYNPKEVEDIEVPITMTLQSYVNQPLYYVEGIGEPVYEIAGNLNERYVLRLQEACLEETNNTRCQDLPMKDCGVDNVIVIQESDDERIYQEENCVFIRASLANQTRYADAFLFKILGIKA
jgi:hypothetical protein